MVSSVLRAGVRWIQFREKIKPRLRIYEQAAEIRKLTKNANAILIINDYADIAQAVGAEGVHLGQEDLPIEEARKILGKNRIIGISTHDTEQAVMAEKAGADYIGFGPVFHTTTKVAGTPRGLSALKTVKEKVHIPVVAIGGITLDTVESAFMSGADAVAVASAILVGDIEKNAAGFQRIIRSLNH
jgi:thiamine-phosphate pyrophosphorylase